jgi:chromosome partitioning protein
MSAHVITVAQQKGGVGKSTLAVHLAVAFAKQGYSTMLFDTDPQGTVSHWHAQRKQSDIGLIATSGWRLTRDLAMAREANDVIIIDTPPHAEMDIKVSTRAADMVIVPLQPSPADLWAVKETMNTVAGESTNAMVVLNRVVARANITRDTQEKLTMMEIPVAKTVLGNRVLFAAAMESGMTVLDGFKNPAMEEMDGLVGEVASMLGMSIKATKKQQRAASTTQATQTTPTTAKKTATKKTTAQKAAAKTATKQRAPARAKLKKVS